MPVSGNRLVRWEGALLFTIYAAYLAIVFTFLRDALPAA